MKDKNLYLVRYEFNHNINNNVFEKFTPGLRNKFQYFNTVNVCKSETQQQYKRKEYRAILNSEQLYEFIKKCDFNNSQEELIYRNENKTRAIFFNNNCNNNSLDNETAYVSHKLANQSYVFLIINKLERDQRTITEKKVLNIHAEILNFLNNKARQYVYENKNFPNFIHEINIDNYQQTRLNLS